jgi:hypothetical protein
MWLAACLVGPAFVVVLVFVVAGCFGGGGSSKKTSTPPPPTQFQSAGQTKIAVTTKERGTYRRTFVVHAVDRNTGASICNANVTVYGTMTNPHIMTLIERSLHPMRCGTYEGNYTFIMPGDWTANFVLRTKQGSASTAVLPLKIGS